MAYSIKNTTTTAQRRANAKKIREAAADLAYKRSNLTNTKRHPSTLSSKAEHKNNGEEDTYASAGSFMSFSKGLRHDHLTGFPMEDEVAEFRARIDEGEVAKFDEIPIGDRENQSDQPKWTFYNDLLSCREIGGQHRRWEAPTAGFVYDLQGPDAQAVTMPPAPTLVDSSGGVGDELAAEMAEVYLFALLRDVPFASFTTAEGRDGQDQIDKAIDVLKKLPFYKSGGLPERERPKSLSRSNVLRGQTPGERVGPYLSQFLLLGDAHLAAYNHPADGLMQYGSISIDQRVRVAEPYKDYMTHWHEWLDVQHGANVRDTQSYVARGDGDAFSFIATPRDMATYVHFDALYEAYLNACIWLLNAGAPVDPCFRNTLAKTKSTEGFALYGGPHVLTLVTEVATRALKAVRYQKFNNHLRARPEVLAARIAAFDGCAELPADAYDAIEPIYNTLSEIGLLEWVKEHNEEQNERANIEQYLSKFDTGLPSMSDLPLLPMAFPEGSPMHPAYGAGHATVAGACVTMLKAFFDESAELVIDQNGKHTAFEKEKRGPRQCPLCYEPSDNGAELRQSVDPEFLTVGGELNKLAGNISIGRNMGGVHYYTDYIESMKMGEAIAIGILEEQALTYTYGNSFNVSFTRFDGTKCEIKADPYKGTCNVIYSDK